MRPTTILIMAGVLLAGPASLARADIRSKAAREAAEYVLRKFGVKVAEEGTETLARRITTAAARHGDEVFAAVRRVGPKALAPEDAEDELQFPGEGCRSGRRSLPLSPTTAPHKKSSSSSDTLEC